jgi:hypothetical protein
MVKIKISKDLVLNGTDNNGFRHRYSFDKTKNFKKGFIDFMGELGFDSKKIEDKFIIKKWEYTGEGEIEKIFVRDVFDLEDMCWFFHNEKFEIDIFFGKDKVIILIRTRDDNKIRREMLDELERKSDWISEKEKEKRLRKNKKSIKSMEIAVS